MEIFNILVCWDLMAGMHELLCHRYIEQVAVALSGRDHAVETIQALLRSCRAKTVSSAAAMHQVPPECIFSVCTWITPCSAPIECDRMTLKCLSVILDKLGTVIACFDNSLKGDTCGL